MFLRVAASIFFLSDCACCCLISSGCRFSFTPWTANTTNVVMITSRKKLYIQPNFVAWGCAGMLSTRNNMVIIKYKQYARAVVWMYSTCRAVEVGRELVGALAKILLHSIRHTIDDVHKKLSYTCELSPYAWITGLLLRMQADLSRMRHAGTKLAHSDGQATNHQQHVRVNISTSEDIDVRRRAAKTLKSDF